MTTILECDENLLPKDGTLRLIANAVPDPDQCMTVLLETTAWQDDVFRIYGREFPVPRRLAWVGDAAYKYSGIEHAPAPWTPILLHLKEIAETLAGTKFNSVLLNLYRGGQDSMGRHSDDEKSLGPNPVIASLSLGAERFFHVRHKRDGSLKLKLPLPHGSCLIMGGAMQHHWQHALPKTARPVGARINLTYRWIDTE